MNTPLVEQNRKSVSIFVALNLVLAYVVLVGLPESTTLALIETLIKSVTAISVIGILAVVIGGIFPPEIKARIDGWRADAGRVSDPFGYESILSFQKTPEEQAAEVARWRDAGGSHVSIVTMGCGFDGVDAHIAAITRWRELV